MRDRYLFSADRTTREYRTVLEITPGHARLVTPSAAARVLRWILSLACFGVYTAFAGLAVVGVLTFVTGPAFPGWGLAALFAVIWFAGFILLFGWWDRETLPLLADSPAQATDLILLGATSYGTFQEVRAKTMRGEEMRLVVDTRSRRFWEAVGLLEGKPAPSG